MTLDSAVDVIMVLWLYCCVMVFPHRKKHVASLEVHNSHQCNEVQVLNRPCVIHTCIHSKKMKLWSYNKDHRDIFLMIAVVMYKCCIYDGVKTVYENVYFISLSMQFYRANSGSKILPPLCCGLVYLLCWLWIIFFYSLARTLCHCQSQL